MKVKKAVSGGGPVRTPDRMRTTCAPRSEPRSNVFIVAR